MGSSIFVLPLLLLLLIFHNNPVRSSHEHGHITAEISNKGLDFLKDILIQKSESSLIPLELSDIEKSVKIPLIGRVTMVLSNITIEAVHVASSTVRTGEDDHSIVLNVSGSTADLSTNWKYSYKNLFFVVSDKGNATIEVEGLEIGLVFRLKTLDGSLSLSLSECRCDVTDIDIDLNGGASWLYQGLVDAFEGKISSAVENAISKKIEHSIQDLDSLIQSIPKEVPVTHMAVLNTTLVDEPELSETSLDLEINGLFSAKDDLAFSRHDTRLLLASSSSCKESDTMVKILLHEDVFNSLSSVYFEANRMHWTVHKFPDQSLLNTTEWKSIIPQLYDLYPDKNMNLHLVVSSSPNIQVEYQHINVTVPLDVTVDVLDDDEAIHIACFSAAIGVSVSARISGNAVAGSLRLINFTLSLKWSKVGDLPMDLIQDKISTALKTAVLPYANATLVKGFKLPVFHGYELQDAQILYTDSWIVICSDVGSIKQFVAI